MPLPTVAEALAAQHTPQMRRVMVGELRPSHVPVAWHAANGMAVAEIAHKLGLARNTIESALRDIRAHLGLDRTVQIRTFHVEIGERFEAAAEAAAAQADGPGSLLTPAEVSRLFRVDPKTVTRWAATKRLASIRTPGGHRRFREADVRALLAGDQGGDQ